MQKVITTIFLVITVIGITSGPSTEVNASSSMQIATLVEQTNQVDNCVVGLQQMWAGMFTSQEYDNCVSLVETERHVKISLVKLPYSAQDSNRMYGGWTFHPDNNIGIMVFLEYPEKQKPTLLGALTCQSWEKINKLSTQGKDQWPYRKYLQLNKPMWLVIDGVEIAIPGGGYIALVKYTDIVKEELELEGIYTIPTEEFRCE
ncbi:MAG: hypothetical protein ACD_22C00220G0008 [uncultured bacterium]|nr:MAG: hypothetical protein ACD_22C00220G0008 [uncultured bacterium]